MLSLITSWKSSLLTVQMHVVSDLVRFSVQYFPSVSKDTYSWEKRAFSMLLWSFRIETLLEVYGNEKYQVFVHLYANVSIYSMVKSMRNVSTVYFFQETLLGIIKTLATSSSTVCNVELRLSQHSFPEPTSFVVKSKNRGPWQFQFLNPDLTGEHCKWTKWGWAGACVQAANQTKTESGQTGQTRFIQFQIYGHSSKEQLSAQMKHQRSHLVIIVYWKLARIVMTGNIVTMLGRNAKENLAKMTQLIQHQLHVTEGIL